MARIYLSAEGDLIYFDGTTKHRFATEAEAQQYAREDSKVSAMQEWADSVRQLTKKAEALIDATAPGKRLRTANGLDAIIEATADDELVPGSDMTKERATELLQMYDTLETWLMTPLWEGGPAPIQIISRRE